MPSETARRRANWYWGLLGSLVLAAVAPSAYGQTPITVYQNDFETINTGRPITCTRFGGSWSMGGTLALDYDTDANPFTQIGSADRLCLRKGATHPNSQHEDPRDDTGRFAVGFHGGDQNLAGIESFGLVLDPDGQPFLNVSFLSSPLTVPESGGWVTHALQTGDIVPLTVSFYKVPAGATVSLVQAGYGAVATARANGAPLVALHTERLTAVNNNTNLMHPEWKHQSFGLDTSTVTTGERLFAVFSGLPQWRYMGFDNLLFTASTDPAAPPQISKRFSAGSVNPGGTATLTINVAGNNTGDLPGMAITDVLPVPLQFTSAATSNTCGGTLTATAGSNTLSLADGVLPAAGCTITAEVQWPASALAQCNGTVTNTIADGVQFSFSPAVATAGTDATADLACPAAAVVTPVPTNTPLGLAVLVTAVGLATAWRRRKLQR